MNDVEDHESPDLARYSAGAGETVDLLPVHANDIAENGVTLENNDLRGDTAAAITFLENWSPGGPWVLTSIFPDGVTTTATFDARSTIDLAQWIDHRQGRENIYFSVNEMNVPVQKKALKDEITVIRALHVDVDPHADADFKSERDRAQKVLLAHNPPPTVIIDSGGGFQGFWLLGEPLSLPRTDHPTRTTAVANIEQRNKLIGFKLEGDKTCHNIDRIMRVPGTINIPNKKKRGKGRSPALARLVQANWAKLYKLEDFPKLETMDAFTSVQIKTIAPPPKIAPATSFSLEQLPISPELRAIIIEGKDPGDPQRWSDRSRLVLHVLCELIRADVSDEVMKAIILDSSLAVSAHVLDQRNPDHYADRQIKHALEKQARPGPILHGGAMDWARSLRDVRFPHLKHYHSEFLAWDGAAYLSVSDGTIRAGAWAFLEMCRAEKPAGNGINASAKIVQFKACSKTVTETLDALRAVTHVEPTHAEPPRWLAGTHDQNPLELVSTRSGLLHLPTGALLPATPDLFTRNALEFAHDPTAPEPTRWLQFLNQVWPNEDDTDCISALQEFMGYLLTPDTSLQKALMMVGPIRSGKGTIGRIMSALIGKANTVSPTLGSLGTGQFSLEPLLAKQLAIVSDMRLSNRTDQAAIAENILRVTGEDQVSVNRKFMQAVEVTLRTRFVIMTNEVPKFTDRSGAIVSRFIILPIEQSFFGQEDTTLTDTLMKELPGILNWAIDGWRRVRLSRRITQPKSGKDAALIMGDLASPIRAFLEDCCELGPAHKVEKFRLFEEFKKWHRSNAGSEYLGHMNTWARDLFSGTNNAVKPMKAREGERRLPMFAGIALRLEAL